jgi:UDP-glucose:tetrahydrobiopterin glucosyltransferase
MSNKSLKLLVISTPVGPLGSGLGGGVELTVYNLVQEMQQRNHKLTVVAPEGSKLDLTQVIEIPGKYQITAQTQDLDNPIIMPMNSVLGNMWEYARQYQQEYDLIFNIAYDWLPFYLTPFFETAIAHFISMGSLMAATDEIMGKIAAKYPKTIGVYTQTQADTFPFSQYCQCLGSGIDLSLYEFNPKSDCARGAARSDRALAWLGRIAPEKGLEDAVAAAEKTEIKLKIMGKVQDEAYWQKIQADYPNAPIEYLGFLSTNEMQKQVRNCQALIMTSRWVEAFGNVAIEALACGVPVISYNRGGPAEIVRDGKTGYLVTPDSVEGLVAVIERISEIDRHACREQAEREYSLSAWGDRMEQWFYQILAEF